MINHIISVDTGSLTKLKDTYEALDYIAKAGYKFYDLSIYWAAAADNLGTRPDYVEETLKLRKYAENLGLTCVQSHSFFTTGISPEEIEMRFNIISQDIRITKLMGAQIVVAHPIWELSVDENVAFLNRFVPLLEELDMKLAIENVWGVTNKKPSKMCSSDPEAMAELLDKLNNDHFTICLDIGHAEMCYLETSAIAFIEKFGNKIGTLHIHDNDKYCDLHQIPYTYQIDFDKIFEKLAEVKYAGPINFEVERCYGSFPKELYVPVLTLLREIANYWKTILEK